METQDRIAEPLIAHVLTWCLLCAINIHNAAPLEQSKGLYKQRGIAVCGDTLTTVGVELPSGLEQVKRLACCQRPLAQGSASPLRVSLTSMLWLVALP